MRKWLKNKLNNDGNTFIVIMVTITCMSILVAAILMSVSYYLRVQKLNLKDKSNFYYLEQAMDEIYQGVGNDSINALASAYNDTVSVMIYYDGTSYVPLDTAAANQIMKQKFLQSIADDITYKSQAELYNHLKSFVTEDDITLVDPSTVSDADPKLYLEVVATDVAAPTSTNPTATKRVYDKLIIHNVCVKRTTDDGYQQVLTTDIEITEPDFQVSFDASNNANSALYEFAMIADMGVEFNSAATDTKSVSVTGNVYAASDYYNKDYNNSTGTRVSKYYSGSDPRLAECNGSLDPSKYSGIYCNDSNVSIMAEKVIVPGSISVINDGSLSITGNFATSADGYADVWADNIILAPASLRTVGLKTDGGNLDIIGNIHVSDDTEVNNDKSTVSMAGNYYGYNYSQTADMDRVLSEYAAQAKKSGGEEYRGHYNSSAIIVNGNAAKLDFTDLDELYVAGRSYIQTTQVKQSTTGTDTDGNQTATVTYVAVEDTKDVQTGESISVKSNQVAYMPNGLTADGKPKFTDTAVMNNKIIDIITNQKGWVNASQMTIAYDISGKTYYFLNFTSSTASTEFFTWYANDLPNLSGMEAVSDLANVRKYSDFQVEGIELGTATDVTTSGAYTTGALNLAANKQLTVSGASSGLFSTGATASNFNAIASRMNTTYMEMKYTLQDIDLTRYTGDMLTSMTTLKSEIAGKQGKEVTPINYYMDFTKLNGMNMNGTKIGSYYVWASDGDVTINSPALSGGKIMGVIIAKGDVNFTDDTVTRFEGLIISGSKIKVNHKMDFVANPEIVKTILRTADDSKGSGEDYSGFCDLFKFYESSSSSSSSEEHSVSTIQVGDVLAFENWKKNVQ